MLKPTKQAYLKHDLFRIHIPEDLINKTFPDNETEAVLKQVTVVKMASKGLRFVYCETDRKDGRNGWYTMTALIFLDLGECQNLGALKT